MVKKILFIFCVNLALCNFAFTTQQDERNQFDIVMNLCTSLEPNTGFIAGKALLKRWEKAGIDRSNINFLKEMMILCLIKDHLLKEEVYKISEEVIDFSTDSLSLGCAWLQKAEFAFSLRQYEKALSHASVAQKYFKVLQETIDSNEFKWWEKFLLHLHAIRGAAFEAIGNNAESEKEKESFEILLKKLS